MYNDEERKCTYDFGSALISALPEVRFLKCAFLSGSAFLKKPLESNCSPSLKREKFPQIKIIGQYKSDGRNIETIVLRKVKNSRPLTACTSSALGSSFFYGITGTF